MDLPGYDFPNVAAGTPLQKVKTIALAADGVSFIFDDEVLFSNIQFIGEKAVGTPNTSEVEIWIRQADGDYVKSRAIAASAVYNWPAPQDGPRFSKRSFKLKVSTNGDGVRVIYS